MQQTLGLLGLLLLSTAATAHDMFLVVPDHDLPPQTDVTVSLFNGTFEQSENTIDRERMVDVSVVDGEGEVSHPAVEQWRDQGQVTLLDFRTGSPGTYVVGVSTRARMIELSAEDFNDYLEHDGVLDVLEARRREGTLDRSASERYSKHVKTILQVGETATESYLNRLYYPIEIVPLANPAGLQVGDSLDCLVLADGDPVAGQLVYASYVGYLAGEVGESREAVRTRTDDAGVARLEISRQGRWYVRLIRMVPSADEGVDYESSWATLTFEVR
jgi:uncharacterized GH25 family protein